ncbi:hypothetical protein CVT24_009785 [Panaeolus cyanescens]|uniref:Uncharacterized protein n=1 Tax=Panaeolus cyanescens TaxID=181874 RepID=A0A409VDF5_9AGAR|nr:hypothetical protein CVT24_009785 [Panaeolus cyanescens]
MPPKSIFRQPGAKHFQLVHRSQRDPLINDPEASKHVLKPFERDNTKKGKTRADLESILAEESVNVRQNVGEASLYGVYFDDTEYDYMQHLRPVGVQEDGVDSILIEAPAASKSKSKSRKNGIQLSELPDGVLPSQNELPRNYESQQAIPSSLIGFQPDMDAHLRQVLEALEDDAFVDDNLEEDFFEELVADGERGSDEEFEFEFAEEGIDEQPQGPEQPEDDGEEESWQKRFADFKKSRAAHVDSDDECSSEGRDTISNLPEVKVIGGKGKKRRKGSSEASGYSMSSSSMFRNEALQTLDERFDQMILKQYNEDEDDLDDSMPDDSEEEDEAPDLITSRDDFDSMVNEFLNDYEILGRKMKPKLEGETGPEKLDSFRRAIGQDERVRITTEDDDQEDDDDLFPPSDDEKKDRWDCETILTTYTNLENHPRLIRARNLKPVPKITIDPKSGFPVVKGVTTKSKTVPHDDDSDTSTENGQTSSFIPNTLLLFTVLVVLLPVQTYAFGAGDIPDFAYLNDKAFRHGDIENVLETLAKTAGGVALGAHGGGLLGFASSVIKQATGGSKFNKNDIKRVYFGNWLRDYSQAMDIAGLSKLSADTLVLVVSILGFMTFGYSTEEFQVTADRLGVYLPVEHIDNPKGYAEKEGDARQFHPKLRPPVRREELEIDERTGMKNYMATENRGWDTSTAFIRRTFKACIEAGRRANGQENADLWEAYRLLGTGLHTMEDLLAHSNWCEIALRKMGHREVFCHVGDRVLINTPNGQAPPLVTGTFGGADFLHSLLGEAGDKLSQASVTDLSQKMDSAQQGNNKKGDISVLKNLLSKLGGGGDSTNTSQAEKIEQESKAYNFDPNNVAPPEVQQKLKDLLKWHDDVMRNVSKKIEMVPGLSNLMDEISDALNEYIYTVLAPYVGPLLVQATGVLDEGSKAVIDNDDQYEVFNNPNAHDPSHSMLSKDHFGLVLNEPAGKIAKVVVEHTVNLIVQAWSNRDNADNVINQILEAFHHPYYATGRSQIQNRMFDEMQKWFGGLGSEGRLVIQSLTKESVRDHKNKRQGYTEVDEPGYHGCGSHGPKKTTQAAVGYAGSRPSNTGRTDNSYNTGGGYQSQQHQSTGYNTGGYGSKDDGGNKGYSGGYGGQRRDDNDSYGSQKPGYGQRRDDDSYGSRRDDNNTGYGSYGGNQRRDDTDRYGSNNSGYGNQGRRDDNSYGSQRRDDNTGYGGYGSQKRDDDNSYGSQRRDDSYGSNRRDNNTYGSGRRTDDDDKPKYGSGRRDDDDDDKPKYGGSRRNDDNDNRTRYGGGRRDDDDDDKPRYGGGRRDDDDDKPRYGGGRRDDDDDKPKYGGGRDDNNYGSRQPAYGGSSGGYGGGSASGYAPSYGQTGTSGYAPSYGQGQSFYGQRDDDKKSKKKKDDDSDDDRRRRKGKKDDSDDDDDKRRRKGKKDDSDDDDDRKRRGQNTGYAPSYGGRSNETYGVERMNIGGGRRRDNDSDDDDDKKHRRGGRY